MTATTPQVRRKGRNYPNKKTPVIKRSQFKRVSAMEREKRPVIARKSPYSHANILSTLKSIKEECKFYRATFDYKSLEGKHRGYLVNSIRFFDNLASIKEIGIFTRDTGDGYWIEHGEDLDYIEIFFMKLVIPGYVLSDLKNNVTIYIHNRKGEMTIRVGGVKIEHRPDKVDKDFVALLKYLGEEGICGSGISDEFIVLDEKGKMIPIQQGDKFLWEDEVIEGRYRNYYGLVVLLRDLIADGWVYEVRYGEVDLYARTEVMFKKGNQERRFTFLIASQELTCANYQRNQNIYAKFNIPDIDGFGDQHYTITGIRGSCFVRGRNNCYIKNSRHHFKNIEIGDNIYARFDDQGYGILKKILIKMGVHGYKWYKGDTPPEKITLADFPTIKEDEVLDQWKTWI